jgi:imidazoleglycerol-phosphate dehydratase / histidinol-phosphatase
MLGSAADKDAAEPNIRRFGVAGRWESGRFILSLGAPEANNRALAAFGVAAPPAGRRAEIVRETKETCIIVRLDLDCEGSCEAATGIGFFDHMLSQIALHGGFSLALSCDGDLHIDGHHTIEDCALALGAALKQALGVKRGLSRFGFVLPMDETEARVSVDLGGRPYLVFEGSFKASHIGAYPTEMTEHVFRSLAQSMGAAIHVHVDGENDHHKTEACFKAFGRALRQALRVEGETLPSTKGVMA